MYDFAIKEIDDSVGNIMQALKANGLAHNTLVVFTSDNGPARGGLGQTGNLRGRKGDILEGGMRMPTVAFWPDKIKPGTTSDEILTAMDLLPTFAGLADIKLAPEHLIDGKDIWPVLSAQPNNQSPHDYFYYYSKDSLQAVRSGQWKLFEINGETQLYNLNEDKGETQNVAAQHPNIVERLMSQLQMQRRELGHGSEIPCDKCRPIGYAENPIALTLNRPQIHRFKQKRL